MISYGVISMPRRVESLGRYGFNQPFSVNTLNGFLGNVVAPGSSGQIKLLTHIPGVLRGYTGEITFDDAQNLPLMKLPAAQGQFELAPKEGPWTVIGNFFAQGTDVVSGRLVTFRWIGVESETSNLVEFYMSDKNNLSDALAELSMPRKVA